MSEKVISVENVSKRYRIGLNEQADTFAGQLKNLATYPIKNFKRIANLTKFNGEEDPSIFWALQDINFEVKQGEVLGIIGHNGAGKSTLLKILSRITEPTTGQIKIKGRVSALLEVGTGFHPELSGRDNVYMNGTILGMRKREIDEKFDEIVSFSGVEKHIDTPVKFYSSGMRVRLAFSVAAHLEPEILIIDEVLAVGDAEFQKKCLGKMEDVAEQGRTVLFVSHNMGAVKNLCSRSLLLKEGNIIGNGDTTETLNMYASERIQNFKKQNQVKIDDSLRNEIKSQNVVFSKAFFKSGNEFASDEPIDIYLDILGKKDTSNFRLAGSIVSSSGHVIGTFFGDEKLNILKGQKRTLHCCVTNHQLTKGEFLFSFSLGKGDSTIGQNNYDVVLEVIQFEIVSRSGQWHSNWKEKWGEIYFNAEINEES